MKAAAHPAKKAFIWTARIDSATHVKMLKQFQIVLPAPLLPSARPAKINGSRLGLMANVFAIPKVNWEPF